MDLDIALVSSLVHSGSVEDVANAAKRISDPEWLKNEDARKAFKFIVEYWKDYKAVPTVEMVAGKTGVNLSLKIDGAPGFFVDEVNNRRLHSGLAIIVKDVLKFLESASPAEALIAYENGLRKLREYGVATSHVLSLPAQGEEFLKYYDLIKSGARGIQCPWESINEATMGFWPEDLILFVARMGIGKTWALTMLAEWAWAKEKKRVLFATTEMSQEKIAQRFYALHFKLPYEELRKGKLPAFQEEAMRKGVKELLSAPGLYIVGGDFDFRIESLEAAIQEAEPDIVIIDGAYLLRVSGDGRTEKAANTFDELKRVGKRNKVPVVGSTQFNREVKANNASSVSAEKVALTDAAGWNADLMFGLVMTEDMRRDKRMMIKPLKFREGIGTEIECQWDFESMSFAEIPSGAPTGGGGFRPQGGGGGGGYTGGKPSPVPAGDLFSDDYGADPGDPGIDESNAPF